MRKLFLFFVVFFNYTYGNVTETYDEIQQIRKGLKKQNKNNNYDPILGEQASYLEGRDSYVNPVLKHNEQKIDVVIDTLNAYGVKSITIGNNIYTKTPNGLDCNYIDDDKDLERYQIKLYQAVYRDIAIELLNKLDVQKVGIENEVFIKTKDKIKAFRKSKTDKISFIHYLFNLIIEKIKQIYSLIMQKI